MQPISLQDSLLVAFSPQRELLGIATQDGRLKAFHTATGRLAFNILATGAPSDKNGKLAGLAQAGANEQITSIVWAYGPDKAKKNGRVGAEGNIGRLTLAAGTAVGTVRAFSAATTELVWTAKNCNEGGVASLAFADGAGASGMVYSVGADSQVAALEASSGAQVLRFKASSHPLSCVGAAPDCHSVLVGSSSLALWNVVEQQRKARFVGHSLPVRAIAFSPAGQYALSASEGERQVALWRLAVPSAKKRRPSSGLLSLEEPAMQLATAPTSAGGGGDDVSFQVAAVSAAGRAYVWGCSVAGDDGRIASTLSMRIDVEASTSEASDSQAEGIIAAHFESADVLLIARGSAAQPVFERIQLPADKSQRIDTHLKPITDGVLVQARGRGGEASTSGKEAGGKSSVAYVGADPIDAQLLKPKVLTDGVLLPSTSSRKRRAVEQEEAGDDALQDAGTPLENGPLSDGPTLGQRLEALQLKARADAMDVDSAGVDSGPLKADSVSVLLSQALQAQDKALLEKCLNMGNEKIINNSVRRLRPHLAAVLLEAAVERLRARANRGAALTTWIRAVLANHTAYLMAAPGVLPILASLSQTIEARTAQLKPLAALAGRLDLLVSHMPKPDSDGGPEQLQLPGPAVVYVEDDEVEAEDALASDNSDAVPDLGDESEADEDADEVEFDSGDMEDE